MSGSHNPVSGRADPQALSPLPRQLLHIPARARVMLKAWPGPGDSKPRVVSSKSFVPKLGYRDYLCGQKSLACLGEEGVFAFS